MLKLRLAIAGLLLAVLFAPVAALAAPARAASPAMPVAAQSGRLYFAETGHNLGGGFLEFWRAHNGSFLLGLPLTEEFSDGGLTTQYFERGRLEYHPDYPAGQRVVLSRLGAMLHPEAFPKIEPFPSNAGHLYFPETGYSLFGGFLQFWQANGGLAMFGFPLSEEFKGDDGRTRQLFERAMLVLYPEFETYTVIPEPLGYEALVASGMELPLAPYVELLPPKLQEGRTLLVRVHDQSGAQVSGSWDSSRPIVFTGVGGGVYGGVTGETALGATGDHKLTLKVSRGGQERTVSRTIAVIARAYPVDRVVLDAETSQLLDPAITTNEYAIINAIFAKRSGPPQWSGPFKTPVPTPLRISAYFGERRAYNDGPVSSFHGGMDIAVDQGTPVRAPAPGTVVLAERLQVRGNAVIIDHGAGVYTLFGHMSRIDVQVGQKVDTGDVLGLSGNTGLSTGPHLHWELHASGPGVDPLEWTVRSLP